MLVKASRIASLTDARYFAAKGVDFLGFNLEEGTPGYLDPLYMKAIREWVEGPEVVGEFGRTPLPVVREAADFFGLQAVQIEAGTDLDTNLLSGLRFFHSISPTPDAAALARIAAQTGPAGAYFLLEISGAAALETQAEAWKKIFRDHPVFLQMDAPADVFLHWIERLRPAGIGLCGSAEERVGVKSFEEMEAVFEGLGL